MSLNGADEKLPQSKKRTPLKQSGNSESELSGEVPSKPSSSKNKVTFQLHHRPRVTSFLEELSTSPSTPTIADLKRFEPDRKLGRDLLMRSDLKRYRSFYESTLQALANGFNAPQVAAFCYELGLEVSKKRKGLALRLLMERLWNMPSPAAEEQKRKDEMDLQEQCQLLVTAFLKRASTDTQFVSFYNHPCRSLPPTWQR